MNRPILLVDDSLTVRMDLGEALRSAGFNTVSSDSVASARKALAAQDYGLMILDVHLPDGDGINLLGELREAAETRELPIMILSSERDALERVRRLPPGRQEFVGKPYHLAHVLARASKILRGNNTPGTMAPPRTVLIVDDSLTFREALREALVEGGYRVVSAASGEEGLRVAAGIRLDAAIVDGVLPGMDGMSMIRKMRLDPLLTRTPCLLLTAAEEDDGELRALDEGADAYLRKGEPIPVILAKLAALIRSHEVAPETVTTDIPGPASVLIAGDSSRQLAELTPLLERGGYSVASVSSDQEVLTFLAARSFDAVVLGGANLGHILDTVRKIRMSSAWRAVALIVLSEAEDREGMIAALEAGADDYVGARGSSGVLLGRLRAQVRRRQREEENRSRWESVLREEKAESEARAANALAEVRATLLADLEQKNVELKQSHALIKAQNEALERAQQQKAELTALVVHDLKSPLTGILGNGEFALSCPDIGPEPREILNDMMHAAQKMHRMVVDILDISKSEDGQLIPKLAQVEVGLLFEEVVQDAKGQARVRDRALKIACSVAPDAKYISADVELVRRILENLVDNCIKYSPSRGEIRLEAVAGAAQMVEISVRDQGPGVPPEFHHKIFEKYVQLDHDIVKRGRSSRGLGLVFCKLAAEAHGGAIWVEDNQPTGTNFRLRLPAS